MAASTKDEEPRTDSSVAAQLTTLILPVVHYYKSPTQYTLLHRS